MEKQADFVYDDKDSYYARSIRNRGEKGINEYLDRREKTADMLFEMNEADILAYDAKYSLSGDPIIVAYSTKLGDVTNQTSVHSAEPSSDHSDLTAKALADANYA